MIQIRKAAERGHFDHGWLDTYHTFSFADYYDPGFMGFRALRVINEERNGKLRLVASQDGADGSLTIHQDAKLFAGTVRDGESIRYDLQPGRYAWLQVARGTVDVNGQKLNAGDGAAIEDEKALTLEGQDAEVRLFDLN